MNNPEREAAIRKRLEDYVAAFDLGRPESAREENIVRTRGRAASALIGHALDDLGWLLRELGAARGKLQRLLKVLTAEGQGDG